MASAIMLPDPPLGLLKKPINRLMKNNPSAQPSGFGFADIRVAKPINTKTAKSRNTKRSSGCACNEVSGSDRSHMSITPHPIASQSPFLVLSEISDRERIGPINVARVNGSQIVGISRDASPKHRNSVVALSP